MDVFVIGFIGEWGCEVIEFVDMLCVLYKKEKCVLVFVIFDFFLVDCCNVV